MIHLVEASAWATLAICFVQRGMPLWLTALAIVSMVLSAIFYFVERP